jgi:hypothetical protein
MRSPTQREIIIGRSAHGGDVTVEIDIRPLNTGNGNRAHEQKDGKLSQSEGTPPSVSIVGNVWQRTRRDIESGGQIQDHILDDVATWIVPREKVARLAELWNRWHLNHMRAACEHQRERGETWQTHPSAQCPECGYKLGHAWLYEPIPADVLAELQHWPNTPPTTRED